MLLLTQKFEQLLNEQANPKRSAMWGTSPSASGPANLTSEIVDFVLAEAIQARASDIHIEPFQDHIRIRFRIDGKLYEVLKIAHRSDITIVPRIKILSNLPVDSASGRKAMDSRFTSVIRGQQIDFRVSTFPTLLGEKIVLRILNKTMGIVDLKKLGMSAKDAARLEKIIQHKSGLLVVSGPTGGGKTTTLYSVIHRLHSPMVNIVTLEDPVEYQINGINQCAINQKGGESFAAGLKAILRQDPDVILIGEIRDQETAEIAVRASITGHLVITSLHSNSALGTVIRLTNMGIEKYMVSYALIGAVAQRLVPRLCEKCRTPYKASTDAIKKLCTQCGLDPNLVLGSAKASSEGGLQYGNDDAATAEEITLYKRTGCAYCSETGYQGRMGIYEVVLFTEDIREAIIRGASTHELEDIAKKTDFSSLALDALEKLKEGFVTIEDIYPILLEKST